MCRISIIIPIYKESKYLENNIDTIFRGSFKDFEIILEVDCPTRETENKIEKLKKRYNNIYVFISKERRGKVCALNHAIKRSRGELIVFFDSDIIVKDKKILEKLWIRRYEYDYCTGKFIAIRDGIISRIFYYENMTFSFLFKLADIIVNRIPGIYGPFFCVKRELLEKIGGFKKVISEDLQMGFELYSMNARFKYYEDIEIYLLPPENFKVLVKQKKRWNLGLSEYFYNNLNRMHILFLNPRFLIFLTIVALIYYPSLPLIIMYFFLKNPIDSFLTYTLYSFITSKIYAVATINPIFFPIINIVIYLEYLKNITLFLILTVISLIGVIIASKIAKFRIYLGDVLIYYFIYSTIHLSFLTTIFLLYSIYIFVRDLLEIDWKV